MAFGPITSWQIEGEKVEAMTNFLYFGFKIIVASDHSHDQKTIASWQERYDRPIKCVEKQINHSADKSQYS